MSRVRLNILKKGDRVLFVNGEHVAVERVNGEVDVLHIYLDEDGLIRLDSNNTLTIGYGNGSVEISGDDDIRVETF